MNSVEQLVNAIQHHVIRLFQQHHNPALTYHNLSHTEDVVKATEQIAAHYHLSDDDLLTVYAAAWLHDVGYLFAKPNGHEEKSAELAATFLQEQKVHPDLIEKVKRCILVTKLPQSPQNLLEEIICDSDMFHLGTEAFKENNKALKKEKEMMSGQKISGQEWRENTIQLLEAHHYFTLYCQTLLKQGKEENLQRLKNKLTEKKQEETEEQAKQPSVLPTTPEKEPKKTKEDRKAQKENRPDRGIETMFRLTSSNHLELSGMADSKANIMISVSAIIVSVLLSVLLGKLGNYPNLIIPTIIFLITCVLTMIFAVLATRPTITTGTFTKDDIQQRKTNLLFFGNFYRMKLNEYEWGMTEMMNDRKFLYSSLIRDIYFLGVVLGRKYRLLRIAYNIFMYGFVISVLAFAIAVFFFPYNK